MPDLLLRPEIPVIQRVEWRTPMMFAHDGSEQRMARNTLPRTSMNLTYIFETESEVQEIREDLLQSMNSDWRVPVWWDRDVTTAVVASGADTWPIDLALSDLVVNDTVYIEDPFGSGAVFTVSQVNANDIHTTTTAGADYAKGTHIYPLKTWSVRDPVELRRQRVGLEELKITFDLNEPEDLGSTGASLTTYQPLADDSAKQLLPDAPLSHQPLGYVMSSEIQRVDNGAKFSQFNRRGESFVAERRMYQISSRQELQNWTGFLMAVNGMRDPFYAPTFRKDLTLTSQPTVGSNIIKVNSSASGVVDYAANWWPFRYENLRLATDAGDIYREVTTVSDNGDGTSDLQLDDPLPATVAGSTVNQISFLEHVRLGADVVTISHDGIRSVINLAIQTAPDAKDTERGADVGDYLFASLSADQTTNKAVNNHVEFDLPAAAGAPSSRGTKIALQIGAGQADGLFDLTGGSTYRISVWLTAECTGTWQIFVRDDSDDSSIVDTNLEDITFLASSFHKGGVVVYIKPASDVTIKFDITSLSGSMTRWISGACNALIEEVL